MMKKFSLFLFAYGFSLITCYTQGTWVQKANIGGSATRDRAVGFSIPNIVKGYIGMGSDNGGILNDFWEYNPLNNTWTQKANYPGLGNNGDMGFYIGSKGYICGG